MLYTATFFSQTTRLQPMLPEEIFEAIAQPTPELTRLIHDLRRVLPLDETAYRRQKTQLPYFCGSEFREGIRRADHFVEIQYFVLDLDDCYESDHQFALLQARLFADDRVMMRYVSPSGRGIKLLFMLAEPIVSTKEYAEFYRRFAAAFGRDYGLEECIDMVTCDVSRVSFLSADPAAAFRSDPTPVDAHRIAAGDLPPQDAPALPLSKPQTPPEPRRIGPVAPGELPPEPVTALPTLPSDPSSGNAIALDDDVFALIRNRLNPRSPKPAKQAPFVPDRLHEMEADMRAALQALDLVVEDVREINYGLKYCISYRHHTAEVNVFYGSKGFSVVKSPKAGTNPELCELVQKALLQVLML